MKTLKKIKLKEKKDNILSRTNDLSKNFQKTFSSETQKIYFLHANFLLSFFLLHFNYLEK